MRFNEDTRVKIPALVHFLRLGYKYVSLKENKSQIDDKTYIFKNIFLTSLTKINKRVFSIGEIEGIVREISMLLDNNDGGKAFYERLTDESNKVKLIDFQNFNANSLNVVTELEYSNNKKSFRPDITILINGIPIGYFEVKIKHNEEGMLAEFNRELKKRQTEKSFHRFYNLFQIMGYSNNQEYDERSKKTLNGSFYSTPNGSKTSFQFFREEDYSIYKKVNSHITNESIMEIVKDTGYVGIENTPEFKTNLELGNPAMRFITSIFSKERLFFFLKYGIVYVKNARLDRNYEKHIIRYPQYFAIQEIVAMIENPERRNKGIIWHTQGSGKTSLAYFATRYLRNFFQKRGIISKSFFVVDRLDLFTQSAEEFIKRGATVEEVESKSDFIKKIQSSDASFDFTVTNIQKFSSEKGLQENDKKGLNIQRIYFIDEAHRSYSPDGIFLINLFKNDKDGIFIGLTGTPILKDQRTKEVFGEYIHKYFYDKSIADGYTLRIKKEIVSPKFLEDLKSISQKLNISKNTKLDPKIAQQHLYESDAFCEKVVTYIQQDFENFKVVCGNDSVGAMIITSSTEQAKKLQRLFEHNTKLHTSIVISEESKEDNKDRQNKFKKGETPVLIVFNMLITGFDAPRLKRLYLFRTPNEHNLLQAITRVNRPFENFEHGYIVDFADIDEEYENTMAKYMEELASGLMDDEGLKAFNDMFVKIEEDVKEFLRLKHQLSKYRYDNLELFSNKIYYLEKKELIELKEDFKRFRFLYYELKMSSIEKEISDVDTERVNQAIKEIDRRLKRIFFENSTERGSKDDIIEAILDAVANDIELLTLKEYELPNGVNIDALFKENALLLDENRLLLSQDEMNQYKIRLAEIAREFKSYTDEMDEGKFGKYLGVAKKLENIRSEIKKMIVMSDKNGGIVMKTIRTVKDKYPNISLNEEQVELLVSETYSRYNDMVAKNEQIKQVKYTETKVFSLIGDVIDQLSLDRKHEDEFYDIGDILVNIINEELENNPL